MLPKNNNDMLDTLNIDEKYYLFYQVWKELTDKKTMDSYQYHMMNSLSILVELSTVIKKQLNGYYLSHHNVDDCKSEAAKIISEDKVIKEYYPSIWRCLKKHLHSATDTNAKLRALYYQTTSCYNIMLPMYIQHLLNDLECDIQNHACDDIVEKTKILTSCCALRGWSHIALPGLVDELIDSKYNVGKWDEFKNQIINPLVNEYKVFIPVNLKYKNSTLNKGMPKIVEREINEWDLQLLKKKEIQAEGFLIGEKLPTYPILVFKIQGNDLYFACYKAIGVCSDILNVLSFYNYIEACNFQTVNCWVVNLSNQKTVKLSENQLYETYNYLDSSTKIFAASKRILKDELEPLYQKLQATYAYANLGKAAGSQEEKFINTWIALETLCRGDVYENIISNVLETVPPALCTRYIYRHYRNFLEDCKRCGLNLRFPSSGFDFYDKRDKREHVKDILKVFKDTNLYTELEKQCCVNDLLLFRCKNLYKMANKPDELFACIKNHHIMVKWQLSRLYRLRNEIAHTGMATEDTIVHYIEHLEDYLNHFLAEVLMCAVIHQEYKPEIVFEMIKDNYNAFIDMTNEKQTGVKYDEINNLLKTGIIEFFYTAEGQEHGSDI